jgi:uncharacterized protein
MTVSRWQRERAREPDREPDLPLAPGRVANGEFLPGPLTARDRAIHRLALEHAARAADRVGMDRRRFLQTSGGVAAVLAAYNLAACGGGSSPRAASTSTSTSGPPRTTTTAVTPTTARPTTTTGATATTAPGGTFEVPEAEDLAACAAILETQGELVVDVHTHHVVPDGPWRDNARRIAQMVLNLVPAGCAEADPYTCLDRVAYLHDMFLASDTAVALLSDVPNSGPLDAPLPWEAKRETRALADALTAGGAPRLLLHDVIAPNFGDLQARLDDMEATAATGDVAAFKVYTAWGPDRRGYALDDPAIGLPVVEQARRLGVHVLCAHKGLPLLEFDRSHNGPADVVAVAAQYPDLDVVVYHAAYERERYEGPYDAADAATGVDSLVAALDAHGIPPGANVWAELGTTWREVLGDPTQAAHVLGKLLLRLGEDRVLWGTDAIWLGSPQPQIMAFRAFQISEELQERHGYPALTDTIKRKVLGLNACRLLGLDPEATRCALDADGLTAARAEHAALVTEGALPSPWVARGPVTRREALSWLGSLTSPWTP